MQSNTVSWIRYFGRKDREIYFPSLSVFFFGRHRFPKMFHALLTSPKQNSKCGLSQDRDQSLVILDLLGVFSQSIQIENMLIVLQR
jgi:hypothetical protein